MRHRPPYAGRGLRHLLGNFALHTSTDITGVEVSGAVKSGAHDQRRPIGWPSASRQLTLALIALAWWVWRGSAWRPAGNLRQVSPASATSCSPAPTIGRATAFRPAAARGRGVDAALAEIGQVVEGYHAARAVPGVATRERVMMPIIEGIHGVLYEGLPAADVVQGLMRRPIKPEFD
jgi:hypothetical protein